MLEVAGEKYFTKLETAKKLKKTTRTLDRFQLARKGPLRTTIGRTPYYSESALKAYMNEIMIMPTLHLNGTSKNALLDQYCDAAHAVDAAITSLCENGPNGRDYYPQGDDAFTQARDQHEARVKKLREVRKELNEIAECIADAEGGR